MRLERTEALRAIHFDGQPLGAPFVEPLHEIGIGELRVDQANARCRLIDERRELPPRALGPDDQPRAEILGHGRSVAVGRHQTAQAGHDRGIVRQHERVARALETLAGEVLRRHDRRTFVGDQVFRVILHDRIGVRVDRRAGALQRIPELLELLLPALGARRDQRVHRDAARDRARQFREDLRIVAPEERQRDLALRVADHVEQGRTPVGHVGNHAVGRHGSSFRRGHIRSRFGCSHATDFTPAASAINCTLRSSSDVRGSSHVWYLTVTSSD